MKKKYTVGKHPLGFKQVLKKPTKAELSEFYSKKYFQDEHSQYNHQYSKEEIKYFENNIEDHYQILTKNIEMSKDMSFLEIGPGEGFALSFFKKRGWKVTGLDYSDFGCVNQNPDCLENIKLGDLDNELNSLIKRKKLFKIIYSDHVLEHVLDPISTLKKINKLLAPGGIFFVGVPNDFSNLQDHLMKTGQVKGQFWLKPPEHISYFNTENFKNVCDASGFEVIDFWASFPIDLNLFNPDTNYVQNEDKGKNCHIARVKIDNFFHDISRELTLDY